MKNEAMSGAVSNNFDQRQVTGHHMNKGFLAAFAVVVFTLANAAFAQAPPAAPPPDSNLALRKFAYQSSTLGWYDASLAVDGIRSVHITSGYVSATALDYNAWWAVDLGATHEIHNMAITFGATELFNVSNINRSSHYGIFAWDDTEFYWYQIKDVNLSPTGEVAIYFAPKTTTRYVLIQILSPGPDYLELGEVRIYGQ